MTPVIKRSYAAGWKSFTGWCLQNHYQALPADLADVRRYLEHLVKMEEKALTTAKPRLAAIAAVHRSQHPN